MKKVLVIRFSSIGDIVLTSPILRCLKKQHPEIEIHYLTKSSFSFIVEQNEYVSKVHTIDNDIDEVLPQLKAEELIFQSLQQSCCVLQFQSSKIREHH